MKGFSAWNWIKTHTSASTLILLLGISSGILLMSGQARVNFPSQVGLGLLGLLQEAMTGTYTGIVRFLGSIQELAELQRKYHELLQQLEDYQGLERTLAELRAENQRLRAQLGFQQEYEAKLLPAMVVGRDPTGLTRTLTINRGHLHGVNHSDIVIAFQGRDYGLVGRVVQVGFTTSQVQTVIDPSNHIAARFQTSRYEGLVSGMGVDLEQMRLSFIRKQALDEIKRGDLVVTSGNNSLYPRGIPIGRVTSIEPKPYETNLEIHLQALVDFSRLEYVFVLSPSHREEQEVRP